MVIEAVIEWLPVSAAVLTLASERTFLPLKTLDALHLATARVARDDVPDLVFATHDRRLAAAAIAHGFNVSGI